MSVIARGAKLVRGADLLRSHGGRKSVTLYWDDANRNCVGNACFTYWPGVDVTQAQSNTDEIAKLLASLLQEKA